jgi:hypothetical protein
MSDVVNEIDPNVGETGDGNVNVPDTTGGNQVPDTIPEPVPVPEPGEKDQPGEPDPGRPGPVLGPLGF